MARQVQNTRVGESPRLTLCAVHWRCPTVKVRVIARWRTASLCRVALAAWRCCWQCVQAGPANCKVCYRRMANSTDTYVFGEGDVEGVLVIWPNHAGIVAAPIILGRPLMALENPIKIEAPA